MYSLLHTPAGGRDLYGEELTEKEALSRIINSTLSLYGYEPIDTPAFEFFDVFSRDIGTIPSKDLYKFFDKEGNTLVLRPDFTPSVARCAAKYFSEEELPLRFRYEGNTYINTSELQGKLNETTQIGFELINDPSIYADAESLMVVIDSLKKAGLSESMLSIGERNYFKGICEEANLDEETEMRLRDYITSKNFYAARSFLKEFDVNDAFINRLEAISKVFLPSKDLEKLLSDATNIRSGNAIARLIKLHEILKDAGYDKFITFDLSMLSNYHYYTGIIFTAYTYGVGNPIAKGGRYDHLIEKFGKEAPSVGCVFCIDEIQTALRRAGISNDSERDHKTVILYTGPKFKEADLKAKELRSSGVRAELILITDENKTNEYKRKAEEAGNACIIL